MFNLKEFIVKNIVNGIKNGTFSKEYGNIMAVNYLVKGILTEEDVANIDAQITAWEQEQVAKEEVESTETSIDETEESTEIPSDDAESTETESVESETVLEETETENTEIDTEIEETGTVE